MVTRNVPLLLLLLFLLSFALPVSVVFPEGEHHGPAEFPGRIGKEALQLLFYGESHQVLSGDYAHDLVGVVHDCHVTQTKRSEQDVGSVKAEMLGHAHS